MPKAVKARTNPVPVAATPQYRPSSSWTPDEDHTLVTAKARGLTWKPISERHFPGLKSPNACRKRHERLMQYRKAQSWDGIKLERLAQEYVQHRQEIWSPLAEAMGEKWEFVETKCMEKGLLNLLSTARGAVRRSSGMSDKENYSFSATADGDSGIFLEDDDAEMDAGRRRQGGRAQAAAGSGSRAEASATGAQAPVIQEPPAHYQSHPTPQPLQPSPSQSTSTPRSSGGTTTAPASTRSTSTSHGPTIASLLSPSAVYP